MAMLSSAGVHESVAVVLFMVLTVRLVLSVQVGAMLSVVQFFSWSVKERFPVVSSVCTLSVYWVVESSGKTMAELLFLVMVITLILFTLMRYAVISVSLDVGGQLTVSRLVCSLVMFSVVPFGQVGVVVFAGGDVF